MLPILKIKFEEHSDIKDRTLMLIDSMNITNGLNENNNKNDYSLISNTDWNIPGNIKRPYWDFLESKIIPYITKVMTENLDYSEYKISNLWFQQYNKSDYHNWHRHKYTFWNIVYYLELSDSELSTELMDINGQIIKSGAKEGEMLVFPSQYKHRSPKNTSNSRKTVIAINIE